MMPPLPPVDHLVWGGQHLGHEIERLERLTGVRPAPGGRHPGEGTHNALLSLGPRMYLELIAPDPDQPPPPHPRWFGLDALLAPRLVTWAARSTELDGQTAAAAAAGLALGDITRGRRELGDGEVLSWRLTYPSMQSGASLVPFLIDWGGSAHPADSAPGGVRLVALRGEHPQPATVTEALHQLGIDLAIVAGASATLVATLDTPRGTLELR